MEDLVYRRYEYPIDRWPEAVKRIGRFRDIYCRAHGVAAPYWALDRTMRTVLARGKALGHAYITIHAAFTPAGVLRGFFGSTRANGFERGEHEGIFLDQFDLHYRVMAAPEVMAFLVERCDAFVCFDSLEPAMAHYLAGALPHLVSDKVAHGFFAGRTFDEYLASLRSKDRQEIKNIAKRYTHLSVKRSSCASYKEAAALLIEQQDRWVGNDSSLDPNIRNAIDLELMPETKERVIEFYDPTRGNRLVGMNLAKFIDDTVQDAMFLAPKSTWGDYPRLGDFAVLENIKWACEDLLNYTLASVQIHNLRTLYKKKFLPRDPAPCLAACTFVDKEISALLGKGESEADPHLHVKGRDIASRTLDLPSKPNPAKANLSVNWVRSGVAALLGDKFPAMSKVLTCEGWLTMVNDQPILTSPTKIAKGYAKAVADACYGYQWAVALPKEFAGRRIPAPVCRLPQFKAKACGTVEECDVTQAVSNLEVDAHTFSAVNQPSVKALRVALGTEQGYALVSHVGKRLIVWKFKAPKGEFVSHFQELCVWAALKGYKVVDPMFTPLQIAKGFPRSFKQVFNDHIQKVLL